MSAARAAFHAAAAARAAALPPEDGLAWVRRHGLLVLARHPDLPADLAGPLAADLRRNLAANLRWIDLFRRAVDALDGLPLGGLPVCALKGIHLLATAYAGDPECRVLTDLDLLVPAGRLDEAAERLCGALDLAEAEVSRRTRRFTAARHLAGGGVAIDLHRRLAVRHSPTSAWDDLAPVPAELHGRRVSALDRETTWVHLVTHWVRHGPAGPLRWVEDLLRWREAGVDPAGAAAVARRLGALTTLVAGERALTRITGEPPPAEIGAAAGRLARARAAAVERRLWRRWLADPLAPEAATGATGTTVSPGSKGVPGGLAPSRAAAAVLLADGPLDAVRALAAKAGERWARR